MNRMLRRLLLQVGIPLSRFGEGESPPSKTHYPALAERIDLARFRSLVTILFPLQKILFQPVN